MELQKTFKGLYIPTNKPNPLESIQEIHLRVIANDLIIKNIYN